MMTEEIPHSFLKTDFAGYTAFIRNTRNVVSLVIAKQIEEGDRPNLTGLSVNWTQVFFSPDNAEAQITAEWNNRENLAYKALVPDGFYSLSTVLDSFVDTLHTKQMLDAGV